MIQKNGKKWLVMIVLTCSMLYAQAPFFVDIAGVHGHDVNRWMREHFIEGMNKTLRKHKKVILDRDGEYRLSVHIRRHSTFKGKKKGHFLGSVQYRYKQSVKLVADYRVSDRWGAYLFSGKVHDRMSMDTGSSVSYADARHIADGRMMESLGESVAERLESRFEEIDTHHSHSRYRHSDTQRAVLPIGFALDLESGRVSRSRGGAYDLLWQTWEHKEDIYLLEPLHSTSIAIVNYPYERIDRHFCKRTKRHRYSIDDADYAPNLKRGTVLVFRTAQGHYGKMRVLGVHAKRGIRHYELLVEWKLLE
jgi:predicted RNA binding protein YcfA (HicA-like mRNA interferase family)